MKSSSPGGRSANVARTEVRAADVIVGLTGLVGSGFEEVACLLYGARSAGQDVSSSGPAKPTSLG